MGQSCICSISPIKQETQLAEYVAANNCVVAKYEHCEYLSRLKQFLKHYKDWQSAKAPIKETQNKPKLNDSVDDDSVGIFEYINAMMTDNDECTKTYSIMSILAHYHHLIHQHSGDYEAIYNYFCHDHDLNICTMSSCNMVSRNHRDRDRNRAKHWRKYYRNSTDTHQVIAQQIFDKIHCSIFHTFDMGFALTKQEKMDLFALTKQEKKDCKDDALEEHRKTSQERIARVMQKKKTRIRELRNSIGHGLSLDDNNKFMSNLNTNKDVDAKRDSMFSFGIRYYYDKDKYKDNHGLDVVYNKGYTFSHWFVNKRYSDLRSEVLGNGIGRSQWNNILHKAQTYKQTELCKVNGERMTTTYLMCLMLYCNFDKFQSEFRNTYRRNADEDDIKLKHRHSEFANFAETLQTAVDKYGIMVEEGTIKTFYHGINRELMFNTTLHKFSGPISTSSEYEVAMVFTQNNGMVLELMDGTLYTDEHNSIYFDCEWISDFGYEKEKLFVSTEVPLKIVSIFHVKLNANYGTYIKLITILLSIVEGDIILNGKDELNDKYIHAIVKLLKHELKQEIMSTLPQYITKLLHYICLNISIFTTRYCSTFADSKYKCLAEFLCCDTCEMFKLDLLCELFPNLTSIAIECSLLTDKLFINILQFLRYNETRSIKFKLNNIVFQSPVHASVSLVNIEKKYKALFHEIDWCIDIENQDKRLILKQNKKVNAAHDRAASTNVLNSRGVFASTELFTVSSSLDIFADNNAPCT